MNKTDYIINPINKKDINKIKKLFIEYVKSLNINLDFQNFTEEINNFPNEYNIPDGALILVKINDFPIGCVGLRKIDKTICEMKRLYVKPKYRKNKIGNKLIKMITQIAKELNYKYMRLDTLPSMISAIQLYKKYGFYLIEAYRYNPIEGALFFEKKLD